MTHILHIFRKEREVEWRDVCVVVMVLPRMNRALRMDTRTWIIVFSVVACVCVARKVVLIRSFHSVIRH